MLCYKKISDTYKNRNWEIDYSFYFTFIFVKNIKCTMQI